MYHLKVWVRSILQGSLNCFAAWRCRVRIDPNTRRGQHHQFNFAQTERDGQSCLLGSLAWSKGQFLVLVHGGLPEPVVGVWGRTAISDTARDVRIDMDSDVPPMKRTDQSSKRRKHTVAFG